MAQQQQRVLYYSIPVELVAEGNGWIARSAKLGISPYGNTKEEARRKFNELVKALEKAYSDPTNFRDFLDGMGIKSVLAMESDKYTEQETWVFGYPLSEEVKIG